MSRGAAAQRVRRAILDWNLRLVAGLPEDVARDRVAQIESDLWEQQAAAVRRGRSHGLAGALLVRAVRGIPADLTWSLGERIESLRGIRREGGGMSRRKRSPQAAREWVHLEGPKPFDQTNGLIAFGSDAADDREANEARDLLEKGVVANTINVGFGGGL